MLSEVSIEFSAHGIVKEEVLEKTKKKRKKEGRKAVLRKRPASFCRVPGPIVNLRALYNYSGREEGRRKT